MKILVIGAGGFVGRHVLAALAATGHEAARADLQPVDCWDLPEAWETQLKGVDGVVYTAGSLRDQAGGVSDLLDLMHHRARRPWPTPARRAASPASCMCRRCAAA